MYNQSMMFNPFVYDQIPCCPFMKPICTVPNMVRSEELNDDLGLASPKETNNLNDDSREDIGDDNIECTEFDDENESREKKRDNQPEEDINDSSIKIEYDDNQFRVPANPDRILRMIERNNPMVIRRLVMYGIPYPVALNITRRIINLTLQYYR